MAAPNTTWQRVAVEIAERIRDGQTPVGEKIASHRELAERSGASIGTVKRAIGYLQDAGVLKSAQGSGVFVQRIPADELDFETSDDDLPGRITRTEQAVAELVDNEADLRKTVGEMQAHLIELYARLGQPYPHAGGANTRQPRHNRTERRTADG